MGLLGAGGPLLHSNLFEHVKISITLNINECWPLWLSHVGPGRFTGAGVTPAIDCVPRTAWFINQLISSLWQRIGAYREVREVFKVVTDFNEIRLMLIRLENMQFLWQIYIAAETYILANLLMKWSSSLVSSQEDVRHRLHWPCYTAHRRPPVHLSQCRNCNSLVHSIIVSIDHSTRRHWSKTKCAGLCLIGG